MIKHFWHQTFGVYFLWFFLQKCLAPESEKSLLFWPERLSILRCPKYCNKANVATIDEGRNPGVGLGGAVQSSAAADRTELECQSLKESANSEASGTAKTCSLCLLASPASSVSPSLSACFYWVLWTVKARANNDLDESKMEGQTEKNNCSELF